MPYIADMTQSDLTPRPGLFPTPGSATLIVVAASVCFGLVPLFARGLMEMGVAPAAIAFFRYAFSGLFMLPFLPLARAKRRDALRMICAGLLMGLGWVSYLEALKTASVAATGVIYMTYPMFALLLAWLLVRQTPSPRSWLGCAMVLGAALILFDGTAGDAVSWALLLSLPAPILFALIIVTLTCLTPSLTSREKLSCGMVGSLIGLAPVVALTDPAAFLPSGADVWLTVIAMGLMTTLIPQFLYTVAAPKIGPGRAAAAGTVELPTMIALGWVMFGEAVGLREITASVLVLTAIVLVPSIAPPRPAPA